MQGSRGAPPRIDPRRPQPEFDPWGYPPPERRSVPNIAPQAYTNGHAPFDGLATAEEASFAKGSLEGDAKIGHHRRSEATKGFVHYFAMVMGCVVGAVFVGFFCVWAWHVVCPPAGEFLPQAKLDALAHLVQMVFSGAAGAMIIKYYSKHM